MPNRNYLKGVRKERQLVNQAREQGLIAFRSAGSHSPIDVVIINMEKEEIRFIQCKPDSISQPEKARLEASLKHLNDFFSCSFEVV
jgi:Holliday junction resolvase